MAIGTDFAIHTSTKVITYTGAAHGVTGAGYYTVLAFHRWLQDMADDAGASGDDYVDISRETPSDKSYDTIITLINGYTLHDTAAEHLFAGSIIQAGGDTIWDGIQVLAAPDCYVDIVQNKVLITPTFWNSIPFGTGLRGLNPDSSNGISHRFMIKVRSAAADIDGRRLILQTREFGFTYSEFKVNGSGRGVNVVPLTYVADLNNATAEATVSGWTGITNLTAGYVSQDVNADSTNEHYYSKWDRSSYSINQFYERMKWLTRRGTASTLYGVSGDLLRGITHHLTVGASRTGTFAATEQVSWGTGATAGTAIMLAIDSTTAATKMWIQLTSGVAPSGTVTITGATSTATCTYSALVSERALSYPFCGVSTGSALLGAYGFALDAADLAVNDKVYELDTGALVQAPNNQAFAVTNLISTGSAEDYVLVGPSSGGVLQVGQFAINGALTGAAVTSVVVTGTLPADTPNTGTIRVQRVNGAYSLHAYSARVLATGTFTISSTDFSTNNAANGANCFISYVDQLVASGSSVTFNLVYSTDRSLFVRVRNGKSAPIKTFESVATFGSAGGSVAAVRTSDA
jgi:hypothetical protein